MNPFLLVKAFVSESVRVVAPFLVRPVVGAIFKYAAAGDDRLWVEPEPPKFADDDLVDNLATLLDRIPVSLRNPGPRSASHSAQEGQQ